MIESLIDGNWLPSADMDPRGVALFRRHYSYGLERRVGRDRALSNGFIGSGKKMVLLTADCLALWAWVRPSKSRADGQSGVQCSIFRNEGPVLSSLLIAEADALAWAKWPGERHWTYVHPHKTAHRRSKRNPPGHCFIEAGWHECGRSKCGLVILEHLPNHTARSIHA